MLPLRQLVKGSVYELKTRCGKPTCHCASEEGPLHSSTVLSWSEHAKTRLRTLPPGERARFRQLTENYRRFRQARAALVKLQHVALCRKIRFSDDPDDGPAGLAVVGEATLTSCIRDLRKALDDSVNRKHCHSNRSSCGTAGSARTANY